MIKQPITYHTTDGKRKVTEDFYFDFNKLEVIEMLQLEDLEETIKKNGDTEDAKSAYNLFKGLVLKAYGKKSPDGRHFFKKNPETGAPYSLELEASPALGELILSFLEKPEIGAAFIQGTLPQHLLDEAKEAQSQPEAKVATLPTTPTVVEQPNVVEEVLGEKSAYDPEKGFKDYTDEELLAMPQVEFDLVVGTDLNKMTKPQLAIALKRKSQ